jgi:hypothetical protein
MIAEEGVNRVGMPDSPTSASVEKRATQLGGMYDTEPSMGANIYR